MFGKKDGENKWLRKWMMFINMFPIAYFYCIELKQMEKKQQLIFLINHTKNWVWITGHQIRLNAACELQWVGPLDYRMWK